MRLAGAAVILLAFLAGAWAMLELVDRLFGGHGVQVTLRPEHRRLLDRHVGWS